MKRIVKLVQATDQETGKERYQDGLQAMWEDRWLSLGSGGRADWVRRHGAVPPALCPLLSPAGSKVRLRLHLAGNEATSAGRLLCSIRKVFRFKKGAF